MTEKPGGGGGGARMCEAASGGGRAWTSCMAASMAHSSQRKPCNVGPDLQLGNLEAQRVARWVESPFSGPSLGPGEL